MVVSNMFVELVARAVCISDIAAKFCGSMPSPTEFEKVEVDDSNDM